MPKYLPPVEHRFKKGVSGNPKGRKPIPPNVLTMRRLTAEQVAEVGTLVVSANVDRLKAIISDARNNPDSKHSALKVWFAGAALKGISRGDSHSLDTLLNRIVGRVKVDIGITGKDGGPIKQIVCEMTKEERIAELAALRKRREETGED